MDAISIVAHDLQEPLAQIQMTAELLLENFDALSPEMRQECLARIVQQSHNTQHLVANIMDLQQLNTNSLILKPERFSLADLIHEVVHAHMPKANAKNIRLELQTAPYGIVQADRTRIRQVLDNLLSNALKFSPPLTTVSIHSVHTPTGWKVSIVDQGPGISDADRQKLFSEFARLSAKPTGGEKSTGLGLSIARRLVQAHGGQIGAESEPNQGATFWFTLPD